ncbi:MAG: DUF4870 domain-containing protein [Verrucomicrobiaceae bacterium]|nr:MAG: DUF4870 domain-containing protein [Verrucomicrobiaceae bacterium]
MPGDPSLLPSKDERMWAMFIHLSGIVGSLFAIYAIPGNLLLPLILWLVKREGAPFINDQGREAVNFQITMTIAGIVCVILFFVCVGVPLFFALGVFSLIVSIIAAVKSNEGVAYRYPLTIRFIK